MPEDNVKERIVARRHINTEAKDIHDGSRLSQRANVYNVHEEARTFKCDLIVGARNFKFITVQQNSDEKEGPMFIQEIHMKPPSVFRPGDELVALDEEEATGLDEFTLQEKFSFETSTDGSYIKLLTVRRTSSNEDGGTDIGELDVEIAFTADMIAVNAYTRGNRIPTRPHRPRAQKRNVIWVAKKVGDQKVLLRTNDQKYLTVRDGAIVGEDLDSSRLENFIFTLEPMKAAYKRNIARIAKVVICCRIRWKQSCLAIAGGFDGSHLELVSDDIDTYECVFKRRRNKGGRFGTGFECLLYKNVYLVYNPHHHQVTVQPYNPRIDIGHTLKNVPASTLFNVVPADTFPQTHAIATNASSNGTPDTQPIDEFKMTEPDQVDEVVATGCCSMFSRFFQKKKKTHPRSATHSETVASEGTLESNGIGSHTSTMDSTFCTATTSSDG